MGTDPLLVITIPLNYEGLFLEDIVIQLPDVCFLSHLSQPSKITVKTMMHLLQDQVCQTCRR